MKLQKSKQGGYERYHVSIPAAIVNSMQWEKGDDLKWSLDPYKSEIRLVLDKV
jgi:hypothetical protein